MSGFNRRHPGPHICFYIQFTAAAAKSRQLCPTLCDPTDGSPPGSPILGILQARTLEWVAISFSSTWKWKMKVKSLSHVWLFMTPWTTAHQAPPSMGFSRQEYWSGLPLPSPIYCYILVDGFFFTSAALRNHQNRQVQVPPHWGVRPIPFLCLAAILTKNFSMSSPTCCYAMSVIVNFMLEKKKKIEGHRNHRNRE